MSLGAGCTSSASRPEAGSKAAEEPPRPGPDELLLERRSADGAVTAEWWGEPPEPLEPWRSPSYPPEYGVNALYFRFAGDPRRYRFTPAGTLYFSDWHPQIFSPRGDFVVLLQDRFGPYHVVARHRLRGYLEGELVPDAVIAWERGGEGSFVPVHGEIRWPDADTVEVLYDSESPEWRRYSLPGAGAP
ncbi:MAG: hypothetical protein R3B09_07615 [Nannocystaceae bacterium]